MWVSPQGRGYIITGMIKEKMDYDEYQLAFIKAPIEDCNQTEHQKIYENYIFTNCFHCNIFLEP
jgi:hypothetical protein